MKPKFRFEAMLSLILSTVFIVPAHADHIIYPDSLTFHLILPLPMPTLPHPKPTGLSFLPPTFGTWTINRTVTSRYPIATLVNCTRSRRSTSLSHEGHEKTGITRAFYDLENGTQSDPVAHLTQYSLSGFEVVTDVLVNVTGGVIPTVVYTVSPTPKAITTSSSENASGASPFVPTAMPQPTSAASVLRPYSFSLTLASVILAVCDKVTPATTVTTPSPEIEQVHIPTSLESTWSFNATESPPMDIYLSFFTQDDSTSDPMETLPTRSSTTSCITDSLSILFSITVSPLTTITVSPTPASSSEDTRPASVSRSISSMPSTFTEASYLASTSTWTSSSSLSNTPPTSSSTPSPSPSNSTSTSTAHLLKPPSFLLTISTFFLTIANLLHATSTTTTIHLGLVVKDTATVTDISPPISHTTQTSTRTYKGPPSGIGSEEMSSISSPNTVSITSSTSMTTATATVTLDSFAIGSSTIDPAASTTSSSRAIRLRPLGWIIGYQ